MKILAVECSASPASCALLDDGKITAEYFINIKTTHSQTLMPMIDNMLCLCNTHVSQIDGVAVSAGPGSFTGIRIGISAVKGLAFSNNIKCLAVSTLLSMAYNFIDRNAIVCCVMDARCNQVYNANFIVNNGEITRICEDRALIIDELCDEMEGYSNEYPGLYIIVVGDGAELFYKVAEKRLDNIIIAPEKLRFQKATGVAFAALPNFKRGETIDSKELLPVYLRLPQAERELKLKSGVCEK